MEDFETIYKNGSRIYKKEGTNYPSVTSIIKHRSPFKDSKPGPASKIGSAIHYHILKEYSDKPLVPPIEPIWGMDFETVNQRIRDSMRMWKGLNLGDFEVIGVEQPIFNDDPPFAGRIDMVCRDPDGILSVLDIKTGGEYPYYDLQMAAYSAAVGAQKAFLVYLDTHPERNPSQIGRIRVMEKSELDASYAEFLECYKEFVEINPA